MEADRAARFGPRGLLAAAARLDVWLHVALVVLTAASVWRYLNGHGFGDDAPLILACAGLLLAVDASFLLVREHPTTRVVSAWALGLVGVWIVLVVAAPSFAWVAVPLSFVVLRVLPFRPAAVVVAVMTITVAVAWTRMRGEFDPTIVAGPVCIAGLAVLAFRLMERETVTRQRLLDDLREAQGDLADAQHRSGMLAERTRLSREIHDSVAQGLTSINLLLRAADQEWRRRPDAAHQHVRQASLTARDSLDEVRRVVRDLAPDELVDGDDTAIRAALHRVAGEAACGSPISISVQVHGEPEPVGADVATAVVRSARGALANVLEHAHATEATVTLTYQPGAVALDIRDNGIGFDPGQRAPRRSRGHGLNGIRTRAKHFGGEVAVESTPGLGTAVAVFIPTDEVT